MKCILLADGRRVDAGTLIGNGTDGFVIRNGCHVLKIPQLLGRLQPDEMIEANEDNGLHLEHLETEKKVYQRLLDVPGVAKCIECTRNGILLEYYPNGSLSEYISRNKPPSVSQRWHWALQATDVIGYCHKRGVLVFDIALRNFLLTDDLNLRLIDFANSVLVPQNTDITRVDIDGCTAELDLLQLSNVNHDLATILY